MPVVIGVDAGGSKIAARSDTRAHLLVDGDANARRIGAGAVAEKILRIVNDVANGEPVDALFVGAAGAGDPAIAAALKAALRRRLPCAKIGVSDDAHIALRAAIPEGDGIVLVAGTGSIAYAEIGGRTYRCGGHGAMLGDEGSGFAIGAAAIRLALQASDGRVRRDTLVREIEEHFGGARWVERARASDVAGIASVAPIVMRLADAEKRSSMQIIQHAATDLFALVKSLVEAAGAGNAELPLVLGGSLLEQKSRLTRLLGIRLRSDLPSLRIVPQNDPAIGALAEARALLEQP